MADGLTPQEQLRLQDKLTAHWNALREIRDQFEKAGYVKLARRTSALVRELDDISDDIGEGPE